MATTAAAHTLNRGYAASSIALEASDWFEYRYDGPDLFVGFPRVHKYDCRRIDRHTIKCPGTVEINDWSDSGFDAGGDRTCEFTGRARFRSESSISPAVRILDKTCY